MILLDAVGKNEDLFGTFCFLLFHAGDRRVRKHTPETSLALVLCRLPVYPKDLVHFQCTSTAEKIFKSRPSNECRFSCFPRLFEVTPALVNKDVINDFWQRHCLKEPRLQEKQNQFSSILFKVRLRNTQIHFKAFIKHTDSPFASSPPPLQTHCHS